MSESITPVGWVGIGVPCGMLFSLVLLKVFDALDAQRRATAGADGAGSLIGNGLLHAEILGLKLRILGLKLRNRLLQLQNHRLGGSQSVSPVSEPKAEPGDDGAQDGAGGGNVHGANEAAFPVTSKTEGRAKS